MAPTKRTSAEMEGDGRIDDASLKRPKVVLRSDFHPSFSIQPEIEITNMTKSLRRSRNNATDQTVNSRETSPVVGPLNEAAPSRKTSTPSASSHGGPVRYDFFMSHGSYETFNYSGWMTASASLSSLGANFWQFRSLDTGSTQVMFGDPKAGLEAYQTMLAQQVCDPPTETASDSVVSSEAAGQ